MEMLGFFPRSLAGVAELLRHPHARDHFPAAAPGRCCSRPAIRHEGNGRGRRVAAAMPNAGGSGSSCCECDIADMPVIFAFTNGKKHWRNSIRSAAQAGVLSEAARGIERPPGAAYASSSSVYGGSAKRRRPCRSAGPAPQPRSAGGQLDRYSRRRRQDRRGAGPGVRDCSS